MNGPINNVTLSIVCPISKMAGRLANLETWLGEVSELDVEVFLVHDIQDEITGLELRRIVLDKKSSKIILREGKFGTAGITRNSVLSECSGQWITFWDSDDIPNVKNCIKAIDNSYDVIVGEFLVQMPNGDQRINRHRDTHKGSITKVSFEPGIWRIIFQKELISQIRFPKFKMGEDQDFLAQIKWSEAKVKFNPSVFYTYNVGHVFQTTASGNSRASLLDSLAYLSGLIDSKQGSESFIRNLASRQFLTLMKVPDFRAGAIRTYLMFFQTPRAAYRQVLSMISMFLHLLRSN